MDNNSATNTDPSKVKSARLYIAFFPHVMEEQSPFLSRYGTPRFHTALRCHPAFSKVLGFFNLALVGVTRDTHSGIAYTCHALMDKLALV